MDGSKAAGKGQGTKVKDKGTKQDVA